MSSTKIDMKIKEKILEKYVILLLTNIKKDVNIKTVVRQKNSMKIASKNI